MSLAVNMTAICLGCVLAVSSEWMWFPVSVLIKVSKPSCCLWAAAALGWPCSYRWTSCFLFPCWLPELWWTPERPLHLLSVDPAQKHNAAPAPNNTKKQNRECEFMMWSGFLSHSWPACGAVLPGLGLLCMEGSKGGSSPASIGSSALPPDSVLSLSENMQC